MRARAEFMERLALASDAGERDVRQAYARELKRIDQERDLEGFQYLRECYEDALAWVARRNVSGGREEEPGEGPDPAQGLSAAVFADFHARFPALAALPDGAGTYDATRAAPWVALLRETLGDPRLLNMDARSLFELRVAELLAGGWQPGHHLLFGAADTVFGWSIDWHALERLGAAGALLETAIAQREMFHEQAREWRLIQRELLVLLRTRTPPDGRKLRQYTPALNMLVTHFPTLMHVVAPRDLLDDWSRPWADVPFDAVEKPRAREAKGLDSYRVRLVIVGIVMVLSIVLGWFAEGSRRSRSHSVQPSVEALAPAVPQSLPETGTYPGGYRLPPGSDEFYELAIGQRSIRDVTGAPADGGMPVPSAHLREIALNVSYSPATNAETREQTVVLQVRLDANGNVEEMKRLVSLADLALADAFEQAIRATGPFGPETMREFNLQYRITPTTQ